MATALGGLLAVVLCWAVDHAIRFWVFYEMKKAEQEFKQWLGEDDEEEDRP